MSSRTNSYLESKPRYEILDGLRGVAALGVVMFPFTMGLLLSRIGRFISIKGGFAVASLLIVAMVSTPMLTDWNPLYEGIFELGCILLLFPLILSIGTGSKLQGKRATKLFLPSFNPTDFFVSSWKQ